MTTAETSKRWFELTCKRCGQCFVEMKDLLFHRCPASGGFSRKDGQRNTESERGGPESTTGDESDPEDRLEVETKAS
ncbi:MAG: hypothetical protein ACHQ4J_05060 [Candidatus Binatia bacterium]